MKSKTNKESGIKRGKKPTKTESYPIEDNDIVMYLHDGGAKNSQYIRVDFNDYSTYDEFFMVMDRETLRGMADFINNYLENN